MTEDVVQKASTLYKGGEKDAARDLLLQSLKLDASNPNAWYGLYFCVDDPQQKKECLRRILAINPNYTRVREMLTALECGDAPAPKLEIIQPAMPAATPPKQPAAPELAASPMKVPYRTENVAGRSTRQMASKRRNSALWITAGIIFIAAIFCFVVLPNFKVLGLGGFGLFVLLIVFEIWFKSADRKLTKTLKESRRATRGAIAEEKVGALLESLGPDFLVLHDVVCDYGNIDHVVIAKSGAIFMVETKSHGGKVAVENGQLRLNGHAPEKDFIAQSLRNSYWLRDRLEPIVGNKPWITPILVFTNAFVKYSPPVKGIHVINKKFILDTIQTEAKKRKSLASIWGCKDEILSKFIV